MAELDRKSTRLNSQSHSDLVCRLLLEKKKKKKKKATKTVNVKTTEKEKKSGENGYGK